MSAPDSIRWWHSIDLGNGLITPGRKGGLDYMQEELARLELPPLQGRSVLDVGSWDGFYAFAAERQGASRVTAFDGFVWQLDLAEIWDAYDRGERLPLLRFDPVSTNFPGRAGFDFARNRLGSSVETLVGDPMTLDPALHGVHDVVLYLGVLYHMENPLEAVRRLASVTGDLAVIETQATEIAGAEELRLCEFYPGDELAGDPSNWWAPNIAGLKGLLQEAGFASVEIVEGDVAAEPSPLRHRIIAHARK